MASTTAMNGHQLSLFNPSKLNNLQINHSFLPNPLKPNFLHIKSNHSTFPKSFLKPSLSHPLQITPASPPPPSTGGSPANFSVVWGPAARPGRADFRVWSGRRAGSSKGKSKRSTITVECTKCMKNRYTTEKNSLNTPGKLELNKYCPKCKIHTIHKEIK